MWLVPASNFHFCPQTSFIILPQRYQKWASWALHQGLEPETHRASLPCFFFNSFMGIPFTYHSMCPFKICLSVFFSVFTELGHHQHNLILEHFRHPEKKPSIYWESLATPLLPKATINLLTLSMDLPIWGISCK